MGVRFNPHIDFVNLFGINFEYKSFCKKCDSEHFSVAAVQLPTAAILKTNALCQKPTMTKSLPEVRRVRFKGIANACKAS